MKKFMKGDRGGGGGGEGLCLHGCIFKLCAIDYTYSFIVGIYNAMFNDLKEGKTI